MKFLAVLIVMVASLCTASNRLRGDITARATAPAPDVVAVTDVSVNRADTVVISPASHVVLDTTSDVASTIEKVIDSVDVSDYGYPDAHVPRFPGDGDQGRGLGRVGPRGVRMMWSKEIHTANLHSLPLLESPLQSQSPAAECVTGLAINPPTFFDRPFPQQRQGLGQHMEQGLAQKQGLDQQAGLGLDQVQDQGQGLVSRDSRDQRRLATATTSNPIPMVNQYGGTIMASTMTKAIFWGPTWTNSTNVNKIAGLDAWYGGYGSSTYATTVSEYTSTGTTAYPSTYTYTGHIVDTSLVTKYPNATKVTLSEVCSMISKYQIPIAGTSNWYFPVYVDQARPKNYGYCAWHYGGKCAGTTIQFGFFWGGLDYDASCQVGSGGLSTTITGNGGFTYTQGLNSLANLAAHEVVETRTDPLFSNVWGGWYDASGNEVADKCAWTYPTTPLTPFPAGNYIDTTNGNTAVSFPSTSWKLQGVWSNNAYTNPTSNPTTYTNNKSQGAYKGCISAGATTTAPTTTPTATPTIVPTNTPTTTTPIAEPTIEPST